MRRSPLLVAVAAAGVLAAGCLNVDPASVRLDFILTDPGLGGGWEVGAADYPVGRENDIALVGDWRPLPAAIGTSSALYQAGTNVTGTLFVYQRKYWTGYNPSSTVKVKLQVEFVSNVHSGCTTGVGPNVVIKAGISELEPRVDPDGQGVYRFSLDKGESNTTGGDFVQLGDIRNGLAGCPAVGTWAVTRTATLSQPLTIRTDGNGGFWMFIGTQSTVQARHEVYFTGAFLTLIQQ